MASWPISARAGGHPEHRHHRRGCDKTRQGFPEFLGGHPDVPWRSMKGMRNRIAHGYFDINLDIVWDTVRTALPPLVERLTAIRDELANGSDLGMKS